MSSLIFDRPQEAQEILAEREKKLIHPATYYIQGHAVHVTAASVFFVCPNFIVLCLPEHPLAHEGGYFVVNGRSGATEAQTSLLVDAVEAAMEVNDLTVTLYRQLTEDTNAITREEILAEDKGVH
jgi:hypothetical protein